MKQLQQIKPGIRLDTNTWQVPAAQQEKVFANLLNVLDFRKRLQSCLEQHSFFVKDTNRALI